MVMVRRSCLELFLSARSSDCLCMDLWMSSSMKFCVILVTVDILFGDIPSIRLAAYIDEMAQ